jgi:hypothetical protein
MSISTNDKPLSLGEKVFNALSLLVLLGFTWLLWRNLSPYWFHPDWTTDDALQQVYPFHRVFRPELFSGDLITEVMEGYLAPLHYWISWGLTWLTGDPIMMSHWLTLIQIGLACLFLFLIVRSQSNFALLV